MVLVVEHYLASSGLDYSILQPSLFMEAWLGPKLFVDPAATTAKVYGNRDVRFRYVSVNDVANVAVQCVSNPVVRNAVIPFGGPEALTQRDAVRLFEQGFGKSFAVTEIPEDALEQQFVPRRIHGPPRAPVSCSVSVEAERLAASCGASGSTSRPRA
jgi:uncharacterized protein YbjT (DUF2867 family)